MLQHGALSAESDRKTVVKLKPMIVASCATGEEFDIGLGCCRRCNSLTRIKPSHSVASRRNGGRSCPFRDAENAAAISRYGLEVERHDSGVRTRAAHCVFW